MTSFPKCVNFVSKRQRKITRYIWLLNFCFVTLSRLVALRSLRAYVVDESHRCSAPLPTPRILRFVNTTIARVPDVTW